MTPPRRLGVTFEAAPVLLTMFQKCSGHVCTSYCWYLQLSGQPPAGQQRYLVKELHAIDNPRINRARSNEASRSARSVHFHSLR